ncbi:GNAT family N-acetyltransferase [Corallincola platygyrae]|uniref:GNAT family N-acetyltransferase n=1 Tax=Corallincola platygyrae TaxID=1193278 RepID=A0ABW4XS44_9GAMM
MSSVDYHISLNSQEMDLDMIHRFLRNSYWAKNIPKQVVATAIANSFCVGAFDQSSQVGFARLVTDRATFAYLADVFVLSEYRQQGISKRMLDTLLSQPEVQNLRRVMLVTADAHGLYRGFGFTDAKHPERMMERHQPDVYLRTK